VTNGYVLAVDRHLSSTVDLVVDGCSWACPASTEPREVRL
jgi:hypothetical protein